MSRRRVEALLAADDGDRGREDDASATSEAVSAAIPAATAADEEGTRPDPGLQTTVAGAPGADRAAGFVACQVIAGRYTLLDVLGEGGMGTVYRAGQTQPVRRQVALKLIRIGTDSRRMSALFDAERQALALMDHSKIARVYDGGTTDAGQPFFVMELVSGERVTDCCDRRRLPVQARLELFVSVCQAVQHAHQEGIIRRNLKPGNVMVSEVDHRPTPKVIGIGVATATEFTLTDQSLGDSGAIVGTPAYISPEQVDPSSMDVDTRTDVSALGVILCSPPMPPPGPARSPDGFRRARPEGKTVAVIDHRLFPEDNTWPLSDADERECRSNGDTLRERALPPKTSMAGSPSPHLADQGRIGRERRPIQ